MCDELAKRREFRWCSWCSWFSLGCQLFKLFALCWCFNTHIFKVYVCWVFWKSLYKAPCELCTHLQWDSIGMLA